MSVSFVACGSSEEVASDVTFEPSRLEAGTTVITPTFYFLPEACSASAKWRMEGKALCRARGLIYDWVFNPHPMFVALPGLSHASEVLRAFGNKSNIIHPMRSVATDNAVPHGSGLYLPAYDGRRMTIEDTWIDKQGAKKNGGRVIIHDGCFYKSDTGGAFRGKGYRRVDVYLGLEANYRLFMPGGRYNHLNVPMQGTWYHPKCASPRWDF